MSNLVSLACDLSSFCFDILKRTVDTKRNHFGHRPICKDLFQIYFLPSAMSVILGPSVCMHIHVWLSVEWDTLEAVARALIRAIQLKVTLRNRNICVMKVGYIRYVRTLTGKHGNDMFIRQTNPQSAIASPTSRFVLKKHIQLSFFYSWATFLSVSFPFSPNSSRTKL